MCSITMECKGCKEVKPVHKSYPKELIKTNMFICAGCYIASYSKINEHIEKVSKNVKELISTQKR